MKFRTVCLAAAGVLILLALGVGAREVNMRVKSNSSSATLLAKSGRFACTLGSKELKQRIGQIRAELLERVLAVDELDGGYRFWLPKSAENLHVLADFVKTESDCCAFFDFAVALGRGAERVSLQMTGEPEAKRLLDRMLKEVGFERR